MAEPRTVELPVCPECGLIGKQPAGKFKGFCIGGRGNPHKRVRMESVPFREVRERVDA